MSIEQASAFLFGDAEIFFFGFRLYLISGSAFIVVFFSRMYATAPGSYRGLGICYIGTYIYVLQRLSAYGQ